MSMKVTVYDAGDEKQPAQVLEMWSIDAVEAVQNDPKRYSLSPPTPAADDEVIAVKLKGGKTDPQAPAGV